MSDKVTGEEMLVWLDGVENDNYGYVDEGRMLDAIRALIDDVEGWKKRAGKMADILDEVDPVIVEFIADIKDYTYGGKEKP